MTKNNTVDNNTGDNNTIDNTAVDNNTAVVTKNVTSNLGINDICFLTFFLYFFF